MTFNAYRPLGTGEQIFWLHDRAYPLHFALTAQIKGQFTVPQLQHALSLVQQRHPFLRVRIALDELEQPWFVKDAVDIPLRVVQRQSEHHWQREVEQEIATPFEWWQAPLVRVVLIQSDERTELSELIVTCHHAIADGIAVTYLIRDILQAMTMPTAFRQSLPVSPPLEDLMVRKSSEGVSRKKYGNAYCQYNYVLNQNGKLIKYGNQPKDYDTDVYKDFAKDFIQCSAQDSKPFFLYLAPFNIHGPYTPAKRHTKLFPGVQAPRRPNFNEGDVSTKPKFMRQLEPLNQNQIDEIDRDYRKRLRSLQSVDEAVGELVDMLKANGQLDNTYIVLTSDNGYKQGIHRASTGKESAYEEDIRLNLVVRGPGIPAGKKLPQQVGNIDFFPTFADMAGVKPPSFVDGRSFLPLLKGTIPELPKWRSAFLVEHKYDPKRRAALENQIKLLQDQSELQDNKECPDRIEFPDRSELEDQLELEDRSELESLQKGAQTPNIPTYQAIRTPDYTYVEYEKTGTKELYNINQDPYQLNNLASTADPTLLKQLAERLNKLRTCEAGSCRAIEDQPFTP